MAIPQSVVNGLMPLTMTFSACIWGPRRAVEWEAKSSEAASFAFPASSPHRTASKFALAPSKSFGRAVTTQANFYAFEV